MSRVVLGINPGFGGFNYHDPSAALLIDGHLVAASEEERHIRKKGAPGEFPRRAIASCLQSNNITLDDVDAIAVGYSPQRWGERVSLELARCLAASGADRKVESARAGQRIEFSDSMRVLKSLSGQVAELSERATLWDEKTARLRILSQLENETRVPRIEFVEHHLAHAASAFCPSPFEEATIVVVDGVGEICSSSIWRGNVNGIERIDETRLPSSLGYLYAAFTHHLGFEAWEGEGKLMALAAYGTEELDLCKKVRYAFSELNGGLVISSFGNGLALDLNKASRWIESRLMIKPRSKGAPITGDHRNLAYSVQLVLEEKLLGLVRKGIEATTCRDVTVAGGVFLNCKANMSIRESSECRNYFCQPVAGDAGLAVGSALIVDSRLTGALSRQPLRSLALGTEMQPDQSADTFAKYDLNFRNLSGDVELVADLLVAGEILIWFHGRSEFGPRALGQRSIIADPRDERTAVRINEIVKERETWRPFAPSILVEHANDIFITKKMMIATQFMVEAFEVREEWRPRLAAVVHKADATARPHFVSSELQPEYYNVIHKFFEKTGIPAVLNTSLNTRGEPIVESLNDMIHFFFTTPLRFAVVNGFILSKR